MISLVIPVLNEQETLPTLYQRIRAASEAWQDDWELIVIDDGSTDGSRSIITQLHQTDPRVKAIFFSRNFGHQIAITAGLHAVSGDVVVVMDADLQDPPEQLVHFLQKWREGYEVVYAIRTQRKEIWIKRVAYYLFYRILEWISSIYIPLDSGDFCVMDRVVVDCLNAMPERNRFVRGLRSWIGYRQIGIRYERDARLAGEVKYTFRKLVQLAIDGLISFSYRPLQMAGGLGLVIALFSFIFSVLLIYFRLTNATIFGRPTDQVPGYTSLILAILFMGGVQLIFMGILGEYIGRVFDEVKQRPLYIVRQRLGLEKRLSLRQSDPDYSNPK